MLNILHYFFFELNLCALESFSLEKCQLMILSLSRKIWENFPPCNGDRHLLVFVSSVIRGRRRIGKPKKSNYCKYCCLLKITKIQIVISFLSTSFFFLLPIFITKSLLQYGYICSQFMFSFLTIYEIEFEFY